MHREYSLNLNFRLLDLLVLWLPVCLGSVALLAYGIYQFRKALRLREYNFRAQVVSDLHDNLSSRLYALKILSDQLTTPAKCPERQAQRNVRLSELALDCMQVIGNIIWAFDPSHNNVDTLLAKVQNFAEKAIRPLVPVELYILDRKRWPHQVINPQTNHLVLMVVQELLTNMIKHTASVKIQIDIYWKNSSLIINIHNYFSKPPATSISKPKDADDHYGLDNISSRLLKIKGELDFDQDSNSQHVHLVVPF
jgi:signal transduction histidine kinase